MENKKGYYESKISINKDYEFSFSTGLAREMELEKETPVMFSFSKKNNCAYVYREDKEEDSFIVHKNKKSYSFSNRDLKYMFAKFFGLKRTDKISFKAIKENDRFKLIKL